MIPLFRSVIHALLWDALAVRRWLRGMAVSFAIGGVAFANDAADIIGRPGWTKAIKVCALALAFVGGAISVGEKNPTPEGELVPLPRP